MGKNTFQLILRSDTKTGNYRQLSGKQKTHLKKTEGLHYRVYIEKSKTILIFNTSKIKFFGEKSFL